MSEYRVVVLRETYAQGEDFENKETAMYFAEGYVGKPGVYEVSVQKGHERVYQWAP